MICCMMELLNLEGTQRQNAKLFALLTYGADPQASDWVRAEASGRNHD